MKRGVEGNGKGNEEGVELFMHSDLEFKKKKHSARQALTLRGPLCACVVDPHCFLAWWLSWASGAQSNQFCTALLLGLRSQEPVHPPGRLARTQLVELKEIIIKICLLTSGTYFICIAMEADEVKSEERE